MSDWGELMRRIRRFDETEAKSESAVDRIQSLQRLLMDYLGASSQQKPELYGDATQLLMALGLHEKIDILGELSLSIDRAQNLSQGRKIALIGTSANPITNGHLTMGLEILALTDVDEVWYYLVGKHAWGKKLMPGEHRLAMAKLATEPYARLKVCDFEITHGHEFYETTMETAEIMRDYFMPKYSKHQFAWVMGSDVAQSFHLWKGATWMAEAMSFYIIHRLGYDFEKPQSLLSNEKHKYFCDEIVTSNISSSLVRERGRDYEAAKLLALVPNSVWNYLVKHRLLDPERLK
ncbi:MAG: hypothetical protein P1V97_38535 [Planctomycetota bacterium]|nr:hypothetical protein [Planctomycetota bacterium]